MSAQSRPLEQRVEEADVLVRSLPHRGNGLFARSDLPAKSQILFIARPLMVAIETSKLQTTCYQCYRSNEGIIGSAATIGQVPIHLKTCSGCHTVKFCDKTCQTIAWSHYHQWECKLYGKLRPRILPSTVRAVIRVLKQRKAQVLPDGEWDQLLSLESHRNELSLAGGERWQDLLLMMKAAKTYSSTTQSLDVVLQIYCIVSATERSPEHVNDTDQLIVNSFTLTTPTLHPIGLVLHPKAALLNHSCNPNAVVRCDARLSPHDSTFPQYGSLAIHALRPISKGEEITVSYIETTFPFRQRQQELQDRYFFTCDCDLCLQRQNAITDRFIPSNPRDAPLDPTALTEMEQRAESVFRDVESKPGSEASQTERLSDAVKSLAQSKVWPLHRYPFPQLRQQLMLALLAKQQFTDALYHLAVLVVKVDPVLFAQAHHPIRTIHAWTFWNLCTCVMEEWTRERPMQVEVPMLGLLSCAVMDDLVRALGLEVDMPGHLEQMVNVAYESVKREDLFWKEYCAHRQESRERAWSWIQNKIDDMAI